ncbi:5-methylcytosine rRNA methyltransferase NSUN4 [Orchesella cincta]|uniref:NOL1/NOP2/Sun domain family member 4 n=1 Tax=Orchesella cincta TaxID=48709 RepID=A0A1D2NMT2_ORCCI|nr:5-methylcytosine rRNA methyltransferase NSUN4 [Orchesella cincta]
MMMHRRCFSSTTNRLAEYARKKKNKMHWADEAKLLNNIQRALTHYDDFYGNLFGKQWPSMRLGLLSPPKYMAIPNTFTGNIEPITQKLNGMGAYNIQQLWSNSLEEHEAKELDLNKDLGRLHQVDITLGAIAESKRAAELDILYQNAPTGKKLGELQLGKHTMGRIVSDVSEAAGDFIPSTKLKGMDDFTLDSEYFSSYLKKHDEPEEDESATEVEGDNEVLFLKSNQSSLLHFPQFLIPHAFENGSAMNFPPASRDSSSNLREYICVNGSSILPVIALDLRPGTNLLDMCAGPGTKSLMALMTMATDSITCNDLESSRLARVKQIFLEFLGTSNPDIATFTKFNSRDHPAREEYSRVLVDVPCLNDRVSCTVVDNNIFKPRRTKERLALVKTQKEILHSGLKAVNKKEGSAIVYSTCTLSPIENDGVVMNALKETEVSNLYVDLVGLMKLITPFEKAGVFRVTRIRCEVLVTPTKFCNYGPMFISRIVVKPSLAFVVEA